MAEGAYGGSRGIARTYALVFGIAYLGVAIAELIVGKDGLVLGDSTVLLYNATLHNIIHFATGLVVLGSAFSSEATAKMVARVVGVMFLLVTVLNIVASNFYAELVGFPEGATTPIAYTIVHAITAAAALYAGFAGSRGYGSSTAAA